jgi:hypothetical protein
MGMICFDIMVLGLDMHRYISVSCISWCIELCNTGMADIPED